MNFPFPHKTGPTPLQPPYPIPSVPHRRCCFHPSASLDCRPSLGLTKHSMTIDAQGTLIHSSHVPYNILEMEPIFPLFPPKPSPPLPSLFSPMSLSLPSNLLTPFLSINHGVFWAYSPLPWTKHFRESHPSLSLVMASYKNNSSSSYAREIDEAMEFFPASAHPLPIKLEDAPLRTKNGPCWAHYLAFPTNLQPREPPVPHLAHCPPSHHPLFHPLLPPWWPINNQDRHPK